MAASTHTHQNTHSKRISTMIKQGFISPPPPLSISRVSLSPPPSPNSVPPNQTTSTSTTLYDMMSAEQIRGCKTQQVDTRQGIQDRISRVLAAAPFRNPSDWGGFGDVKVTITGSDGVVVSFDVHRKVLAEKSRFFADKLRRCGGDVSLDISVCDDVDVYVETIVLMYCEDLKMKLIGENVSKVLGILKVSSSLLFDTGIMTCLEFLEAIPWSEEEEEKVISVLAELQLEDYKNTVLQRMSTKPSTSSKANTMFSKLLTAVLQAKDEKSRRDMKTLISQLLKQNSNMTDISKDTLYSICDTCLSSLILSTSEAACVDENNQERVALMEEIAREADNMQWVLDILIEKRIGEEFLILWADQKELSVLHLKIPTMYRHEISRITSQLCIAIGRGQILVHSEARIHLLSTWLEGLYGDFVWMRRSCRSIDKNLIEYGLSQTILTLPLTQQQSILLDWFDRFLSKGDECPNIQRAFEVWWRRAFARKYFAESRQQITVYGDHTK